MKVEVLDLEAAFRDYLKYDERKAAEIAYALGARALAKGDYDAMDAYRRTSIDLFERLHIDSLEQACAQFDSINGIMIPDLIHEGVVAARLVRPDKARGGS